MRKFILLPLLIASTTTLVSCGDKIEKLKQAQEKVEADKAAIQLQIQQYENYLRTLGEQGVSSVFPIQRQAQDMKKRAVEMEASASAKIAQWSALEKSTEEFRKKVDAWKAKYLK
jgi:multidrug resistance efflux pump